MKLVQAVVFMLLAFLPALSGVFVQTGDWYVALQKPPLNPPGWLFGPVWTLLYALIGLAGFLAWRAIPPMCRVVPFAVFGLQLVLNGLWTFLFFGLHRPAWALLDLMGLWALILINIGLFHRERPVAGYLLVPYFLWVSFAGYLNAALWWLN